MATEHRPARELAVELVPAAGRGEHWWPVAAAIIVAAGLHVVLPARYRIQPVWLFPTVLFALLAVLVIGDPGRIDRQKAWLRIVAGTVIAVITLANLFAAVRLVVEILTNNKLFASHPGGLLAAGAVIWVTNVIAFGLWYWDLNRGGAAARAHPSVRQPGVRLPGDAEHGLRAGYLGAAIRRLSCAGLLDRDGDQPHGYLSDQAVGQAAHDAGSLRLDNPGGARHRPRDKYPLAFSGC
ncbi:MAG TPA: hypothetical protein VGI96_31585, partial [Streptosporangiaceae bacterium]|jgi:hypothetical protein